MALESVKTNAALSRDEELGCIDVGIGLLQCGTLLGRHLVALVEEEEEGFVFD